MTVLTLLFSLSAAAQLAPSPDPQPIHISGVVVGPDGRPAADVTVWLIDALSPRDFRQFGDRFQIQPVVGPEAGLPSVCVETRTDSLGNFALDVPAEFAARRWRGPLALVALGTGQNAAIRRLPLLSDSPITLTLKGPVETELKILDPGGHHVPRALVYPSEIDCVPILEPFGQRLAGKTDDQGRVRLAHFPRECIGEVAVEAPNFGRQRVRLEAVGGQDVRLAPVGRLIGQFVAPDHKPIPGVTVRAETQSGGFEGSGRSGRAEVACNPAGRFEIPAIVAGTLTLELRFDPRTSPRLRAEPFDGVVAAGTTSELAIPLRPAVRISGSVREKGTTRPVSGVLIALNGMFGGDHFALSNDSGIYEGFITRENFQPYGWPVGRPAPFFQPAVATVIPQRMPPPGTDELLLLPLELPRGVDVRGSVVDQKGRPASGARVEATWSHAVGHLQLATAATDRQGRFTLAGLDPLAELTIKARHDGSPDFGELIVKAETTLSQPALLKLGKDRTTTLGGWVLDASGQPVAGATVRVWRMARDKAQRVVDLEPILSADGRIAVRTDAEGRYQAPGHVFFPDEFFAESSAPGRLSSRSGSVRLERAGGEIPAIELRQVRPIGGRVVDRQGKPIPGAVVRQSGDGPLKTAATTDKDGRFVLPGVLEGSPILLVSKAGYRTEPKALERDHPPERIDLGRDDEPLTRPYATLPSPLPEAEEKALARRLLQPLVERVLREGKDEDKARILGDLADIDPAWTSQKLETLKLADANEEKSIRRALVGSLAREDLDEAEAAISNLNDPFARAASYQLLARQARTRAPDRVKRYVEQSLLNHRAVNDPRRRILGSIELVELLVDTGKSQQARKMIEEMRALIQAALPLRQRRATILGFVVVPLARLDAPSAIAELQHLKQESEAANEPARSFDLYLGRMACALAERSPEDADKLLRQMSFAAIRPADNYVLAACARMAVKDPERARRLTELIAPGEIELKPYALGLIAEAVAGSRKKKAAELLDEAFDVLDRLAASGRVSQFASIAGVAGGLLPIVERADPGRLPEFLARALVLRPSRKERPGESWIPEHAAPLAMMVARYDRELAARVLEPSLEELGQLRLSYGGADQKTGRILCAEILIEPRAAVERIEALPDSFKTSLNGFAPGKNEIVMDAARLLSLHGEERWRHVYQEYLLLWTPDQEVR
jgi:5-hydroxyisourate hydrolase-like protein (transthyretin family)